MIVSVEIANTKRCPAKIDLNCIGDGCMWWRWTLRQMEDESVGIETREGRPLGFCGVVGGLVVS